MDTRAAGVQSGAELRQTPTKLAVDTALSSGPRLARAAVVTVCCIRTSVSLPESFRHPLFSFAVGRLLLCFLPLLFLLSQIHHRRSNRRCAIRFPRAAPIPTPTHACHARLRFHPRRQAHKPLDSAILASQQHLTRVTRPRRSQTTEAPNPYALRCSARQIVQTVSVQARPPPPVTESSPEPSSPLPSPRPRLV